jgi:hypothetical protein
MFFNTIRHSGRVNSPSIPTILSSVSFVRKGLSLSIFWIDIQEHAIKSLDFAYENSLLSVSQKQGLKVSQDINPTGEIQIL